jgi:paraquat-inducible protein A
MSRPTPLPADLDSLVACHDCDLLLRAYEPAPGEKALCPRCGALLLRGVRDPLDRTLALTVAALFCFLMANLYPFMTFSLEGRVQENRMISGVIDLWRDGFHPLASVIFAASIGVPLLKILGFLYLLLPLKLGRRPRRLALGARVLQFLQPWGMLEVYMLGVLVAISKLSGMATIVLGTAFYAFVALMVLTTAASSSMDPRLVWQRLGAAR